MRWAAVTGSRAPRRFQDLLDSASETGYNSPIKRLVESDQGPGMTQPKRADKEDQLLEAATHLFKEKGYHSTSMQELAEALGLQKGSLYYYIESKEELLRRQTILLF